MLSHSHNIWDAYWRGILQEIHRSETTTSTNLPNNLALQNKPRSSVFKRCSACRPHEVWMSNAFSKKNIEDTIHTMIHTSLWSLPTCSICAMPKPFLGPHYPYTYHAKSSWYLLEAVTACTDWSALSHIRWFCPPGHLRDFFLRPPEFDLDWFTARWMSAHEVAFELEPFLSCALRDTF